MKKPNTILALAKVALISAQSKLEMLEAIAAEYRGTVYETMHIRFVVGVRYNGKMMPVDPNHPIDSGYDIDEEATLVRLTVPVEINKVKLSSIIDTSPFPSMRVVSEEGKAPDLIGLQNIGYVALMNSTDETDIVIIEMSETHCNTYASTDAREYIPVKEYASALIESKQNHATH